MLYSRDVVLLFCLVTSSENLVKLFNLKEKKVFTIIKADNFK